MWLMWLLYRPVNSSKDMSCFCKLELHRHVLYYSQRTGPLGSMLSSEFHFMEEQKHHTLAIGLAVISHVSLLYIYRGKTTHVKLQPVFFISKEGLFWFCLRTGIAFSINFENHRSHRGPWHWINPNRKRDAKHLELFFYFYMNEDKLPPPKSCMQFFEYLLHFSV